MWVYLKLKGFEINEPNKTNFFIKNIYNKKEILIKKLILC